MDKQQTAVEWLIEHIRQDVFIHSKSTKEWNQVFKQAKEMEKAQIVDAYHQGVTDEYGDALEFGDCTDGESYYNETYGGNK